MVDPLKRKTPTEIRKVANCYGFGSVLLQLGDDSKMHPIQYKSKKTNAQQEKHTIYKLELLAVFESLKKFRS